MKTLRTVLAASVVAGGLYAMTPVASASRVRDPQRFCRTSDGNGWSVKDVEQGIRCAVDHWRVPGGASRAISIAKCESGLRVHSSNSCCHGVFQEHEAYWRGRFHQFNPHRGWQLRPQIENGRSNIVISIRLAHAKWSWRDWACA